jgi:hypothetical protein
MRRDGAVPRALNQRGIEKALRWERGSVKRILRGEEPVPLAAVAVPDDALAELERELGVDLSPLDPEVRRIWLSFAAAVIARTAERNHGEQRRGA